MGILTNLILDYWLYGVTIAFGYILAILLYDTKNDKNRAGVAKNDETDERYAFPDSTSDAKDKEEADGGLNLENADTRVDHEAGKEHIPFTIERLSKAEMTRRSQEFYQEMNKRRSVRFFSDEPFPQEVMDNIIRTGGTSPSGAHTQPWTYVVVKSPEIKKEIREIIEEEEEVNYRRRMGDKWVQDLACIGTDWNKPYLEIAPYLVIVLKQSYGIAPDGSRLVHYYNEISTSISVGLVLAAIQEAGLVTLTSTPLNAGPRLRKLLNRPINEKVMLLLPVGYPAPDATVPALKRKPLEEFMTAI
ncbi:unnamed protein product [Owenia fusiformis]|uniref:Nitroreductase domain-containing protein n=1 Tax=Owenia fusiformis TaxID=6347 RepID=A0A8S4PGV8_OWEFU|nr:unnamed protein product [Owenia fusiformis]